jgi:hypothetical protein
MSAKLLGSFHFFEERMLLDSLAVSLSPSVEPIISLAEDRKAAWSILSQENDYQLEIRGTTMDIDMKKCDV